MALTLLLPSFAAPVTGRTWLVAAHGGAGCTTIRRSAPDLYADAGRALPVSVDPGRPSRIVLCAMGTGRGLEALRGLLAEWDAGRFGSCVLMGCAVTDPVPRPPKPLVEARLLVASASPRLWRLPYVRGLEVTGFPDRYPGAYARMLRDLGSHAARGPAAGGR